MRFGHILLVFLISLVVIGCKETQTVGGKPMPKPVASIVSLSPSTTEITMIGAFDRLRGRTRSCNFPSGLDSIEIVGDVKPLYEKIVAVKPEVIVLEGSLYSPADIEKLKSTVPGATLIEFKASTVDSFIDQLYRFGSATNTELDISRYVDKIRAARSRFSSNPSPAKVAVVMGGGSEPLMVNGTKSFLADVVRAAGMEPVGPDTDKFSPTSPEALLALGAKAIFVPEDPNVVLNDPKLAALEAVRNKKVFGVEADVLLRAGSRVDTLIDALGRLSQRL